MFIKGALSSFWRVFEFYRQGFSAMRLGKTLWGVIFVKLFVIFVLLKIFVFDENLNSTFAKDADKSDFVLRNLINPANLGTNSANSAILNENSINSRTNSNSAQNSKQNQTNSQEIQATLDEIQTNSANSQEIQTHSHKNAAKIHKEQTNESKINTSNSTQKDTR